MADKTNPGLYNKYQISHTDGSPIDPEAVYFVLRLDNDLAARKAAKIYAFETKALHLGFELSELINKYGGTK